MRIKKEFIGSSTYSKILNGLIKVSDKYLDLLLMEGRYDMLEGTPEPKKLEPIKPNKKSEHKSNKGSK